MNIFVVGNSWSIPSLEAPRPAFDQLGLKTRWEHLGITLDAQAEYIIEHELVKKYRVIWLIGHHHRADPFGDGNYLLPYEWKEKDIWGDKLRKIWFRKLTKQAWYWRIAKLSIQAVLKDATPDNLLMIPIYRPNVLEQPWFQNSPTVWNYFLRDLTKDYADGRGHINQAGHDYFAPLLQEEVLKRWQILLTLNGKTAYT